MANEQKTEDALTELQSEFMVSRLVSSGEKTYVWSVANKKTWDRLGLVTWNGRLKQYSFDPDNYCTFNRDYLLSIANFLEAANRHHRRKLTGGRVEND
ncbi:MAG: hypothetical protein IID41_07385 [Planctomycetes bacterium]|nr:hypothetical protein [Planctomycetota bacterium]